MSRCPEALYGQHGDADRAGLCPWCRQKIAPPAARPRVFAPGAKPDLDDWYEQYFDPDWGGINERGLPAVGSTPWR